MLAKLFTCNICGEHAAEGVDVMFVFEIDTENIFVCKSCLNEKFSRYNLMLSFLPGKIKKLAEKYGLFD